MNYCTGKYRSIVSVTGSPYFEDGVWTLYSIQYNPPIAKRTRTTSYDIPVNTRTERLPSVDTYDVPPPGSCR